MTIRMARSRYPDELKQLHEAMRQHAQDIDVVLSAEGILEHMRHALFDYDSVPRKHYIGVANNMRLLALAHASTLSSGHRSNDQFRFDHANVVDPVFDVAKRYCEVTDTLRGQGQITQRPEYFDQMDQRLAAEAARASEVA